MDEWTFELLSLFQSRLEASLRPTHDPEQNLAQEKFKLEVIQQARGLIEKQLGEFKENERESDELFGLIAGLLRGLDERFCLEPLHWQPARLIARSIAYEFGASGLRAWRLQEINKLHIVYRRGNSLAHTTVAKVVNGLVTQKVKPPAGTLRPSDRVWIMYMPDDFRLSPIRSAILLHETSHIWAEHIGKMLSPTFESELVYDYLAARACGPPYAMALKEYLDSHPYVEGQADYPGAAKRFGAVLVALQRALEAVREPLVRESIEAATELMRDAYVSKSGKKWSQRSEFVQWCSQIDAKLVEEKEGAKAQKLEDFLLKPTPWHVVGRQKIEQEMGRFLDEAAPTRYLPSALRFTDILSLLRMRIPAAAHPVVLMNAYAVLAKEEKPGWSEQQMDVFSESLEKWWLSYEFLEREGPLVRGMIESMGTTKGRKPSQRSIKDF